jgi:hypothetical protein
MPGPPQPHEPRKSSLCNVVAAIFVLRYAQTLSDIAGVAADPTVADDDFVVLVGTLQRASGGLLLLLGATVLSVCKPRGMAGTGSASSVPTGTSSVRCDRSSRTDAPAKFLLYRGREHVCR